MPEKNKTEKGLIIAAGVAFVVFVTLGGLALKQYLSSSASSRAKPQTSQIGEGVFEREGGEGSEIPTLSPREKEIISQLENHVVVIENQSFSPGDLTVKAHDQVEWQNKDNETYQIKGEDWGNVPIGPGESFTQAFATPGTYAYSCALHPGLTGRITVR